MKMKKACEATSLTERAIRLYLSKNLISPNQLNGTLDFSPDDIQHLKDIALLRQFDFSLEQISSMITHPENIPAIVANRLSCARLETEHSSEVHSILSSFKVEGNVTLHSVADRIRTHSFREPTPNFGQFDEISEEKRQYETLDAFAQLHAREKRMRKLKKLIITVSIFTGFAAIIILYLAHTRIQGFLSFNPFTITELNNETITVRIDREELREIIQTNHITVPYRAHGVPLAVGDTIDSGCQLALDISNFDLLRIGINPLQTIQTHNTEINREWMKLVIRSLFAHSYQDEATLWIREYNPDQLRQIFLWDD